MTPQEVTSALVRNARRWWPVVVLPALIAASAAWWSVDRKEPSFSVVTTLVTVPLAQWDETFLGTSLVRDTGNPGTTATTLAAVLESQRALATTADELGDGWTPAAVDRSVTAAAVPETNLVEVTVRAADREVADRISEEFVDAVLADRWETIADELDQRIAALRLISAADPDAGEAATRLQTLTVVRRSGADPTLRVGVVERAVEEGGVPGIVVVAFAALGGAAIGLLFALGAAQVQRRRSVPTDPSDDAVDHDDDSDDDDGVDPEDDDTGDDSDHDDVDHDDDDEAPAPARGHAR